jgi:NitT/TauT family transport system permease protein
VFLADVQRFILPPPSAIWAALGENRSVVLQAARSTSEAALLGLIVGSVLGCAFALLVSRFHWLGRGLTPFAVVAASTPIIVLAPIANIWFGITSPMSKISVVAIVAFFPVFVNAVGGLESVAPSELELMRSYGASPLTVLTRLRIPSSLPMLFVGLRIAASLAMITTIISEYFGGSRRTLGVYITQRASVVRFDEAWAGIVAACVVALILYGSVQLLERVVAPWNNGRAQS